MPTISKQSEDALGSCSLPRAPGSPAMVRADVRVADRMDLAFQAAVGKLQLLEICPAEVAGARQEQAGTSQSEHSDDRRR